MYYQPPFPQFPPIQIQEEPILGQILEGLKELWAVLPDVAVNAGILLVALGVLKGVGILKRESWVQFGNMFGAWLLSDRVDPANFEGAHELYMTAVLAAGMFQVYKLVRNNWETILDFFKKALEKQLEKKKEPPASTGI